MMEAEAEVEAVIWVTTRAPLLVLMIKKNLQVLSPLKIGSAKKHVTFLTSVKIRDANTTTELSIVPQLSNTNRWVSSYLASRLVESSSLVECFWSWGNRVERLESGPRGP